jgi:PAS domain S-box-containing protein
MSTDNDSGAWPAADAERLRVALAAGGLGDWSWDATTDVVNFSRQAADLFGIPPGPHMTWKEMQKLLHPDDAPPAAEAVAAAMAERRDYNIHYRVNRPDGRQIWIHAFGRPVYGDDGHAKGMLGAVRDITEQRRLEARLLSETRTLDALNRSGAAIAAELDIGKVVQMVTDTGVEITGAQFGAFFYNVKDAAGGSYTLYTLSGVDRSRFERFPMPRATEVFKPTFEGTGIVRSGDITADPRYGKNAPYRGMPAGHLPVRSYLAVPVVSRSGEVLGGLFFGHAEPDRFRARHERLMVGIAAQAAIAVDNGRLYSSLREFNETLEKRVAAAVAEREQAEAALRQAQKMEAVGQLTGGIAHDFNNLLQIITGNLELLQRALPADQARLHRAVGNALTGSRRAAGLTQRLLAFSRRQPLDPKPIDLRQLLLGMTELLQRTLGETIHLQTVQGAGVWRVEVDQNQLESAIINLALNARDAMPSGGKLTLEVSNAEIDHAYAAVNSEVRPGQYVLLSVSDTGTGMTPEILGRAFEPFFTTKEVGRGSGLGLSMVYGFIRQSGGHAKIYSEEGHGTTVKLYLPRLLGEPAADPAPAERASPGGDAGETILVVEDDEAVRAFSVEALRALGYRVLEAADGPSAMEVVRRQAVSLSLLFTDVVLPGGMTGAQLAEQVHGTRPDLPVLFTTGYARNAIVHHGRLDPGVELLSKPFSISELAGRVRDLLDRT